jgi:hypothetical protein
VADRRLVTKLERELDEAQKLLEIEKNKVIWKPATKHS